MRERCQWDLWMIRWVKLDTVAELTQVMSLNLPMVGAVNYAKGDYLTEFGISEMLATIEAKLFVNKTIGMNQIQYGVLMD